MSDNEQVPPLAEDEEWVYVGTEVYDDPTTRHFSPAARRILNQIPVYERRKKQKAAQ